MRARAYRFSGGIRHPLRNGFTAYVVLAPATNFLFVTVAGGLTADRTRSGRRRLRQLDISIGCQAHTILPYAQTSFVCAQAAPLTEFYPPCDRHAHRRPSVHHIPSHVRDDARPPLFAGTGWPQNTTDLGFRKSRTLPDGLICRRATGNGCPLTATCNSASSTG